MIKAVTMIVALACSTAASARDVAELACLNTAIDAADGVALARLLLGDGPDGQRALILRVASKGQPCVARYKWSGTTGNLAGRYFAMVTLQEYLTEDLGKRNGLLASLDAIISAMAPDRRARLISRSPTDGDRRWLSAKIDAAGLGNDDTAFKKGQLYLVTKLRVAKLLETWKGL